MKLQEKTYIIVANGFADGPAQALRDYLVFNGAKSVITIAHPLVPEGDNRHITTEYIGGRVNIRSIKLPHKPPVTYLFDPFVPLFLPKCDVWFGFNNLACLRGLERRAIKRTGKVVYWAVDFVPNRFGDNIATSAYNKVDKYVCKNVDARVELSSVGVKSRNKYLALDPNTAKTQVVPMGAWNDRTPKTSSKNWKDRKIVFLGHLVERQGVDRLIQAAKLIADKGFIVNLEIIGAGPELEKLKRLSKYLGISKNVRFHGFVKEHAEVESILSTAIVACAPYVKDEKNFVQFSDAGKLKAYLGAGLPIVLTDVPNNAKSLEKKGVAVVTGQTPEDFSEGLITLISDKVKWLEYHKSALDVAKEFDWNALLSKALSNIGIDS